MECPTYSYWFEQFMCLVYMRMGQITRPDLALCRVDAFLAREWADLGSNSRRRRVIAPSGAFYLYAFVGALQSEKCQWWTYTV